MSKDFNYINESGMGHIVVIPSMTNRAHVSIAKDTVLYVEPVLTDVYGAPLLGIKTVKTPGGFHPSMIFVYLEGYTNGEAQKIRSELIAACGCNLEETAPKLTPVDGDKHAGAVIFGEVPGEQRDSEKTPVDAEQITKDTLFLHVGPADDKDMLTVNRPMKDFFLAEGTLGQVRCFACRSIGPANLMQSDGETHMATCPVGVTIRQKQLSALRAQVDEECAAWIRKTYPGGLSKGETHIAKNAWRGAKGL